MNNCFKFICLLSFCLLSFYSQLSHAEVIHKERSLYRNILVEDTDDRLQAFCSITFDNSFVVRDLKVIEGTNGPFVAMPSRKMTAHCPRCHSKNHTRASYCNQCGSKLKLLPHWLQ